MDLNKILNKEFYVVDCFNFIYFPRIIRVIGFNMSYQEIEFITDIIESNIKENKKMYLWELERFKSFEEAKKEAERLNNLEKNKRRANMYNSPEEIFKRKILEESLRGVDIDE